jgi:hypothetical protein
MCKDRSYWKEGTFGYAIKNGVLCMYVTILRLKLFIILLGTRHGCSDVTKVFLYCACYIHIDLPFEPLYLLKNRIKIRRVF